MRAYLYRGISNRKAGKLAEAIEDLKAAILLDARSMEAQNHLGRLIFLNICLTQERLSTMCLAPIFIRERRSSGLSYCEAEDYYFAIACFSAAIELQDAPSYLNNRGLAYHCVGKYAEAIADFTAAIQRYDCQISMPVQVSK